MENRADEGVPLPVRRTAASVRYVVHKCGVGLFLVVVFGVGAFNRHVYDAAFQFPPDWLPLLRLMIPIVAFATWSTVRVAMYRDKRDGRDATTLFALLPAPNGELLTQRSPVAARSPRRTRLAVGSWSMVVAGIWLFVAYFYCAARYTMVPGASEASAAKPGEPVRMFVLPLGSHPDFERSMSLRGGPAIVRDSDSVWLSDRLEEADVAGDVLKTKILLMSQLLLATAFLVAGSTFLSFLPKRGFGHEDGAETVAAEV